MSGTEDSGQKTSTSLTSQPVLIKDPKPQDSAQSKSHSLVFNTQYHPPPPSGYTCKICNIGGHWIQSCPDRRRKAQSKKLDKQDCWFCLPRSQADQNLVVAIAEKTYLTLAKGPLVIGPESVPNGEPVAWEQGQVSPIPGGGHVMIVPIKHTPSMRAILSINKQTVMKNETKKWTQALTDLYANYGCVPLIYEVYRYLPRQHATMHFIPLPKSKVDKVWSSLVAMARESHLHIQSHYPRSNKSGYVWVNTPTLDDNYACLEIPTWDSHFSLQFGRQLAARILGIHGRHDWRVCTVPSDQEARQQDAFKEVFAKYNPVSKNC